MKRSRNNERDGRLDKRELQKLEEQLQDTTAQQQDTIMQQRRELDLAWQQLRTVKRIAPQAHTLATSDDTVLAGVYATVDLRLQPKRVSRS